MEASATPSPGGSSGESSGGGAAPVFRLEPRSPWSLDLGEVWGRRELVWFLALRDVKVRYKQTLLGAAWAVLQPVLTMVVFTVFFGRLARIGSDGLPYPVFAFSALVPWQLFAFALAQSGNSLVADQGLLRKVYFPRLALPIASSLAGMLDFAISLVVLLGMLAWYGIHPGPRLLAVPVFAAFGLVAAFSVGVWLAALNVKYRDFRYTIPFLIQLWMFASPVAYSSSLIPERWRPLYGLNPMAVVIDGFRWALLGTSAPLESAVVAVAFVALVLVGGLAHFRHVEKGFADVV